MVCQSLGHFGPCHCHQGDNKQMLMSMHTLTCVYIHIFTELLPAIIYACAFEYVHLIIHIYASILNNTYIYTLGQTFAQSFIEGLVTDCFRVCLGLV